MDDQNTYSSVGPGISIIICTYNGKTRLDKTLNHLTKQEFSCPLEIVLVDNASTDGTKEYAEKWWEQHGVASISFRTAFQPVPGKSYAQEMGYAMARYDLLLICDDDNWLIKDYVQIAYDIMMSNAKIGALGGWCEAAFENERPDWFQKYGRYFAVSKQGSRSGDITEKKGCLYGAGMVIRKKHWQELNALGFTPLLTCRKGDKLSSGGDTEYCYALRLLGYRIWYDERLKFIHFMPTGRMNLNYVSRIREAMSESNFVVSSYLDQLEHRRVTRHTFRAQFIRNMGLPFIKSIFKILFGSFEQKEAAKEYFRKLKRLAFDYDEYEANRRSISRWLPESKQNVAIK
ncbi:glycosyltransferase [Constantimarinum furrinae]|uniref:Glycosyltransferase family 2 protein n=1 Tax=Constantimarinum furrinae TaxID=2562285 RepID=A0A7G8PQU7_9FLAO|nr:glycosyltransferase [Constantimarinum furrinae]QNJ96713.1 glycosyltransferase family 2 protein [Constantimarinum furrinae]